MHRHIYDKRVRPCCQTLKQATRALQLVEGSALQRRTIGLHAGQPRCGPLPHCRQESNNARSGVHTPRSTLAAWSGQAGAALRPMYGLHKRFVLQACVRLVDETPVALLEPSAGKSLRA